MEPTSDSLRTADPSTKPDVPWFQSLARPILFLIVSLTLVGGFLAFEIPVSVFPNTDFPRIVIGVDNGVMPIDQMLVVITRPIEEAVNSVPGLLKVQSITSRGSAEVDLFFDWNADMILTLQRVDAVVARMQAELPQTAKVETHRLTFAVSAEQAVGNRDVRHETAHQPLGRRCLGNHSRWPRSRISSDARSRTPSCRQRHGHRDTRCHPPHESDRFTWTSRT